MGNKIDKMDESLMQYAPLDSEIITNLYFIHDAFRFMDLISLACESIIRPESEYKCRISPLEDFGMVLKSSGKKLRKKGTFAKILIAMGELEMLIGRMENMWIHDIDEILVKPIKKCICIDSDELMLKRNQIMKMRTTLKESKINNLPNVEDLDKEYQSFQREFKERLLKERKIITEFSRNLTTILEKQLEMNQNSTIHLEALVELLKTNPKKIQISQDSLSDSLHFSNIQSKIFHLQPIFTPRTIEKALVTDDLPELPKPSIKISKILSQLIIHKSNNSSSHSLRSYHSSN